MLANGLPSGAVVGIGGLPHRDVAEAAAFALTMTEVPSIPYLPRRSPAEGAIAQTVVGMRGITVGQYGSIALDVSRIDSHAPVVTDLQHDAFAGFRGFLDAARHSDVAQRCGWVKWQIVGPVTLGNALVRAGVPMSEAYEAAVRAVRMRAQHLLEIVAAAMPQARQLVFVEEPDFADVMSPGFPLAPDTAIDLVSGALAAVESSAVAGLHVCGLVDIPSQLATGPGVLSVPVHSDVLDSAGYLVRFMESGGYLAWGAAPTTGPITTSAERPWRQLSHLWCELVHLGADPGLLRRQAIITPECGLAAHTPAVAEHVFHVAAEIGSRIRDQAAATRWALGA